jgi:hypothetical protein
MTACRCRGISACRGQLAVFLFNCSIFVPKNERMNCSPQSHLKVAKSKSRGRCLGRPGTLGYSLLLPTLRRMGRIVAELALGHRFSLMKEGTNRKRSAGGTT